MGVIPKELLRPGERFTLRCFLTGHHRELSGRGAKAIDERRRSTCKDSEYDKAFATYAGEIEVSEQDYYMYSLDKSAWLYERDKRQHEQTDKTI